MYVSPGKGREVKEETETGMVGIPLLVDESLTNCLIIFN